MDLGLASESIFQMEAKGMEIESIRKCFGDDNNNTDDDGGDDDARVGLCEKMGDDKDKEDGRCIEEDGDNDVKFEEEFNGEN